MRTATFLFVVLFALSTFAQVKDKIPVDTIKCNTIPLIIFDDYSWEYLHPQDADDVFNIQNVLNFDTVSYFNEFWCNDRVYIYEDTTAFDDTLYVALFDSVHDDYHLPRDGTFISKFGPRGYRFHYGVDIDLETGDSLYATFNGKVRYARYNKGGYGNFVIIRHFNGLETCYGHLDEIFVDEDQYVKAGSVIGLGGNTGRSRGPHLHFETRYRGFAFDPAEMIDFKTGDLKNDTVMLHPVLFGYKAKLKNPIYHKIRSGDTLSGIAVKYNTTITMLCKLNGITRNTILRVGKILRVR